MEEVALRREWRVEREAARDVAAVRGASVVASAPSARPAAAVLSGRWTALTRPGWVAGPCFQLTRASGARWNATMTAAMRAVDSVGAATAPLASAQWCVQPYGRWRCQQHRQASADDALQLPQQWRDQAQWWGQADAQQHQKQQHRTHLTGNHTAVAIQQAVAGPGQTVTKCQHPA